MRSHRQGQHTTEFAVLLGIAAVAALAMQPAVRTVVGQGARVVSDVTFGPPEPEEIEGLVLLDISVDSQSDEIGQDDFSRRTTTLDRVRGHAINEDCVVGGRACAGEVQR